MSGANERVSGHGRAKQGSNKDAQDTPLLILADDVQSPRCGHGHDEDDYADGFIWLCSFKALDHQPYDVPLLRRLFHLLDVDGSGDLSCPELQRGMRKLHLGEYVKNPMVLARLFAAIDEDHGGSITEREFLSFFCKYSRDALEEFLKTLTIEADKMRITVTTMWRELDEDKVKVETWSAAELPVKLAELRTNNVLAWIDCVGFQEEAINALGTEFGLSLETMAESMVLQSPKVEILNSTNQTKVARIIVHAIELPELPFKKAPKNWRQPMHCLCWFLCGFRNHVHDSCPQYVASKVLRSKAEVLTYSLTLEQSTLLLVNQRTVISLRCPARPKYGDDALAPGATSIGAHYEGFRTAFTAHVKSYDYLFFSLREGGERVEHKMPESLASPVGKEATIIPVVLLLMNAVFSQIYLLRDAITDWEDILHEQIQLEGNSLHTHHLAQCKFVIQQTSGLVEGLATTLSPIKWNAAEKKETEVEAKRRARIKTARSLRSVVTDMVSKRQAWTVNEELMVMFKDYLPEFEELAADLTTLRNFLDTKLLHMAELGDYLTAMKTDSTNRVLYGLALLTAFTVPMGFFTGLFGMNFTDMAELDPESGGIGYRLFWILLGVSLLLVASIMNRFGLFSNVFSS